MTPQRKAEMRERYRLDTTYAALNIRECLDELNATETRIKVLEAALAAACQRLRDASIKLDAEVYAEALVKS